MNEEIIKELEICEDCGKVIISEYGCSCKVDEIMAEIINDEIVNHE